MSSMARMRVLFALLAAIPVCTAAHAAPLAAIEGMTSTVFQRDQSSFSGVGLRLKIQPPQLVEDLSVVPLIEYWRNKSKLRTFGIESTRKDATLGAFMRYDFKREGWHPYAGAGIGIHFVSDEVEAPSIPLRGSDSLIQGGLLLVGGVSFGVNGNLGNLIEAEYHHLSDQSQFKVNWGLSWKFGSTEAGAKTPSR